MALSKGFSGLNVNALKYLLPIWIGAFTGVMLRCVFACVLFWLTDLFVKEPNISWKDRFKLLLLGVICIYANITTYLVGISMTTPISAAIFSAIQPILVFILAILMFHEQITKTKIVGVVLGFVGIIICVCTQKGSELASNPMLGNALCFASAVAYAFYLIFGKELLSRIGGITVLKWAFTGAALPAILVVAIKGFDAPLITDLMQGEVHWLPLCVLAFMLIFPTCISNILTFIGLKVLDTVVVSIYSYVVLVVATVCSYIFGQDRFEIWQGVGFVMIVVSIYLVEVAGNKKASVTNNKSNSGLSKNG